LIQWKKKKKKKRRSRHKLPYEKSRENTTYVEKEKRTLR